MKKEKKLFYSPINRYNGRQSFRYNFHDLLGFPYQRRNSRSSSNQTRYIINRPKPHRLVSQNANTEPLEKPTLKSPLPPPPPPLSALPPKTAYSFERSPSPLPKLTTIRHCAN